MLSWFTATAARLSGEPLLQAVLAALATLILEDPTTVGCGLLVADGKMAFLTAFIGVSLGIAVGDVGLYGLGRWGGPQLVERRWVSAARIDRASGWFRRNLLLSLLLSRFVPGLRLPTFIAAGVLRAPFARFVGIVVAASLLWTYALLRATIEIGERVLPVLGRWRWPAALVALLVVLAVQRSIARRAVAHFDDDSRPAGDDEPASAVSWFEFLPAWLFYAPVALYSIWLGVRYRGLTLPTAVNPSIEAGGLIGESKSAILDLVAGDERRWIAPYATLRRPAAELGEAELVARARRALTDHGLEYPLVAKPDIGQRGAGVRPVRNEREWLDYLRRFPADRSVVLQQLVPDEDAIADEPASTLPELLHGVNEAGVMYWRHPHEVRGVLFSITLKIQPKVVGDGRRSLRELIVADPRARLIREVYFAKHVDRLETVPARGTRVPLVFAGNHCQGAIFRDGTALATPALLERIHAIASSMPEFWFGRFDVRFADAAAFFRGEELAIVEINGAGAEATHIWDGRARILDAYRTLFRQFRTLYEIGAANRARGFRPVGARRLLRLALEYRRLAGGYPSAR